MPEDANQVTALAAIYAGTRADNTSISNVSLALLGAGAAYITATLAFTDKLLAVANTPDDERRRVGTKRAEEIGNILIARWPHKVMEAIIYGGAGALVIGYTVYTLTLSWSHAPGSTVVFACLYGFAMVSTIFSWTYGFKYAAEAREVLEPKTPSTSGRH